MIVGKRRSWMMGDRNKEMVVGVGPLMSSEAG